MKKLHRSESGDRLNAEMPVAVRCMVTNDGELSAAVFPPDDRSTMLLTAPAANPTDPASVAALLAVAAAADPRNIVGMPTGVTPSQLFYVPPGWSVCGVTRDLSVEARVRYLRDKVSSATYFFAKALAGEVVTRVTPASLKVRNILVTCARGVASLATRRPGLGDLALYKDIIETQTSCRSGYRALFRDERAAGEAESNALHWLHRAPWLLENSEFVLALAHR